jgi:hypothetical protein
VMDCADQPRARKWQVLRFMNGKYGSSVELDVSQGWQDAIEAIRGTTFAVVPTNEFSVRLSEHLDAAVGVMHTHWNGTVPIGISMRCDIGSKRLASAILRSLRASRRSTRLTAGTGKTWSSR